MREVIKVGKEKGGKGFYWRISVCVVHKPQFSLHAAIVLWNTICLRSFALGGRNIDKDTEVVVMAWLRATLPAGNRLTLTACSNSQPLVTLQKSWKRPTDHLLPLGNLSPFRAMKFRNNEIGTWRKPVILIISCIWNFKL
jgi:hypothetical protein